MSRRFHPYNPRKLVPDFIGPLDAPYPRFYTNVSSGWGLAFGSPRGPSAFGAAFGDGPPAN